MLEKNPLVVQTECVNSNEKEAAKLPPINVGGTTFSPNIWRRYPILGIFPKREKDKPRQWLIQYESPDKTIGSAVLPTISSAPDYLLTVDGVSVSTVSKNYSPVTTYDVLNTAISVLKEAGMEPKKFDISGTPAYTRISVILNEMVINGDKHSIGIYAMNSMDKTSGLRMGIYLMRQVCSNGMMAPMGALGKIGKKHVAPEDDITAVKEALEEAFGDVGESMSRVSDMMTSLVGVRIGKEDTTKIARTLGLRKWELEAMPRLKFNFPLDDDDGYVEPLPTQDGDGVYTKWDMLVDLTAVARLNREGNIDRNPNLKRANYIEESVLSCLSR